MPSLIQVEEAVAGRKSRLSEFSLAKIVHKAMPQVPNVHSEKWRLYAHDMLEMQLLVLLAMHGGVGKS